MPTVTDVDATCY